MKITVESTEEFRFVDGARCRVWRGAAAEGPAVVAAIASVAVRTDAAAAPAAAPAGLLPGHYFDAHPRGPRIGVAFEAGDKPLDEESVQRAASALSLSVDYLASKAGLEETIAALDSVLLDRLVLHMGAAEAKRILASMSADGVDLAVAVAAAIDPVAGEG